MQRFISVAMTMVVLISVGCTPAKKGSRIYGDNVQVDQIVQSDPTAMTFYVSTLDSIKPYIHVFPTGIEIEAPNLDPRLFSPPDSVLIWSSEGLEITDDSRLSLGLPERGYEIIGEVETSLKGVREMDQSSSFIFKPVKEKLIESFLCRNAKAFRGLSGVNWQHGFGDLRKSATELGADAVIEIFCSKGVSSFWYPPSTQSIPTFGPQGQIVGSYTSTTPGGIGLTDWKVMGLAVRWIEN